MTRGGDNLSAVPACGALPGRRAQAGFTLFEFAVAATVLAVLAGVLLMRIAFYQQESERVAVQQVVATLRTALALRAAAVSPKGDRAAMLRLTEENPLDWLERKPANYLGEYYSPELKQMPHGNWVFDRRDKCLIYLLNSPKSFSSEASKFLKFKVEYTELGRRAAGERLGPTEVSQGVALIQLTGESDATAEP